MGFYYFSATQKKSP